MAMSFTVINFYLHIHRILLSHLVPLTCTDVVHLKRFFFYVFEQISISAAICVAKVDSLTSV